MSFAPSRPYAGRCVSPRIGKFLIRCSRKRCDRPPECVSPWHCLPVTWLHARCRTGRSKVSATLHARATEWAIATGPTSTARPRTQRRWTPPRWMHRRSMPRPWMARRWTSSMCSLPTRRRPTLAMRSFPTHATPAVVPQKVCVRGAVSTRTPTRCIAAGAPGCAGLAQLA